METVFRDARNKTGQMVKVPVLIMDAHELRELEMDHGGMCFKCGELAEGVELDAAGYKCYSCREMKVYGLENAMLLGRIQLKGKTE